MGKILIIKGADFSENAVFIQKWYNTVNDLHGPNNYTASKLAIDPGAINELGLIGKPINQIKLFALSSAIFNICVATVEGNREEQTVRYTNLRLENTYSVAEGENLIRLTEPIILTAGETILLQNGITNVLTRNDNADSEGFVNADGFCYSFVGKWASIDHKVPIMFGYISE